VTSSTAKRSKFEKLLAVYEQFGQKISAIPDPWASKLSEKFKSARSDTNEMLSNDSTLSRGQFASGFEQGLRDTPDFIAFVAPVWRAQVSKAFYTAIRDEYPEFLARDIERIEKIRSRGKIRTESEYYLVRHQIDALEGEISAALLQEFYFLVDAYNVKG
jgi:hypothetical protein